MKTFKEFVKEMTYDEQDRESSNVIDARRDPNAGMSTHPKTSPGPAAKNSLVSSPGPRIPKQNPKIGPKDVTN